MNKLNKIQEKIIKANILSIQITRMVDELACELVEQPWFTITKISK